jgi:hypothetical protein
MESSIVEGEWTDGPDPDVSTSGSGSPWLDFFIDLGKEYGGAAVDAVMTNYFAGKSSSAASDAVMTNYFAGKSSSAASDATSQMTEAGLAATREATQLQRQMAQAGMHYSDRAMALGGPYRGVGLGALNELSSLYGLGGFETDLDPMTGYRQGYLPQDPFTTAPGAVQGQTPGPTQDVTREGYEDTGPSTSDKIMQGVDVLGKVTGNPILKAIGVLDRLTFDPNYARLARLDPGNTRSTSNAAALQFAYAGIDPSKGVTEEDWQYSVQKIRELNQQGPEARDAAFTKLIQEGKIIPSKPMDSFTGFPDDATFYVAGSDGLAYMPNKAVSGVQPLPVAQIGGDMPDFFNEGAKGSFNEQALTDYYQNLPQEVPVDPATGQAVPTTTTGQVTPRSASMSTGAPPPPTDLEASIDNLQKYVDEELAAGVEPSQATINAIHRINREQSQQQASAPAPAPAPHNTSGSCASGGWCITATVGRRYCSRCFK